MDKKNAGDNKGKSILKISKENPSSPRPSNQDVQRSREEEDLDDEMEEIFHPASERFTFADLTVEKPNEAYPHFDENDYELHRRESFQYHQPLRKLYHHKHRKQPTTKRATEETPPQNSKHNLIDLEVRESSIESREEPSEEDPLLSLSSSVSPPVQLQKAQSEIDSKVHFYTGSSSSIEIENEKKARSPLKSMFKNIILSSASSATVLSPSLAINKEDGDNKLVASRTETTLSQAELADTMKLDFSKPKVQFMLGEESKEDVHKETSDNLKVSHHRQSRRHSVRRKHHGFNIDLKPFTTVLEPEEAETLQTADIDNVASHRFEDPKGMRRHKIKDKNSISSFFNVKKEEGSLLSFPFIRKKYDHEPHELFVELHELKFCDSTDDFEWRQTARWIKYEEDVELGPDKWGKPHVPPLSFHSLLKLRQCLESGSVLLDLEVKDILGISKRVVECMQQNDLITTDQKDVVMRTLLLRHRHVNEKAQPYLRRNSSGYGNLNMLNNDKNRSPLSNRSVNNKYESNSKITQNKQDSPDTVILMPNNNNTPNVEITPSSKRKSVAFERTVDPVILRRVPENSEGAAVLAGKLDDLRHPAAVLVRLAEGIEMPHLLEVPIKVRFLFVLLGPPESSLDYHEVGRAIGALMSNQDFHSVAYRATNRKDLLHAINSFLDASTVVPPGKWERQSLIPIEEIRRKSLVPPRRIKDDTMKAEEVPSKPVYEPLKRTGRIFGGFFRDVRHRYPYYLSDIKDGFNFQCIASVIFIYFAAVSGAVAFGGLLAEKTGNQIGVSETLIGSSISGILFAILSGQPLIIVGTTAPLCLFDETLYKLRDQFPSDFHVFRAWVGIWTAVIAIILVAFDGSVLVQFFSRFMQEIFATIISLIFIVEAFTKLYTIFQNNPLLSDYCDTLHANQTNISAPATASSISVPQPNTALLSTILMIGTFYIAYFLRHFRNSKFLGRSARRALGDFGVPIGLVSMVLLDFFIPEVYTEKLTVPEGFLPSKPRSWLIIPYPIIPWEIALSVVGGFLIFILIFMETQIVELIISKKKLKKGSGFHLDMVIMGLLAMLSGLIGGPWQCAATVRSISHVSSITVWSKTHAPGETPHIVEVKEQRLSALLVSLLVGISMFMAPLLRQVPLAVLFGVFLYMGISALSGVHLYERFLLIFMPVKHHPDFNFVRKVRTIRMHLYTAIQILCIVLLWIVKTYFAAAFPFGLLSMIFVHTVIKRLFDSEEVKALDEEGEEGKSETEDEPDFYEQMIA